MVKRSLVVVLVVTAIALAVYITHAPAPPRATVGSSSVAGAAAGRAKASEDGPLPPSRMPVLPVGAGNESDHSASRERAERDWIDVQRMQICARWSNEQMAVRNGHAPTIDADTRDTMDAECRGVDIDWAGLQQLLDRAAKLGSRQARLAYAQDPMLPPAQAMADSDLWHAWRERAPAYLTEAIAEGDGLAAMMVGVASMQRACFGPNGLSPVCSAGSVLRSIYPRDDVTACAYLLLARSLGVGEHAGELEILIDTVGARLSEQQRAEAAARANRMRHGAGD